MKITKTEFFRANKFYPADDLLKGEKILCRECRKREAHCYKIGTTYAVGLCFTCQKVQDKKSYEDIKKYGSLGGVPEFTSETVKEDRKKYFNSMLQPEREGIPSKEFVEAYPEKARKLFKDRINKAQYVWQDQPGWSNRRRSF